MGYIIGLIIIVLLIVIAAIYNAFFARRNAVKNAFSVMDIMFKKRFDLIPNLVQAVKMYMEHEKELFERITQLRATIFSEDAKTSEKIEADTETGRIIKQLNATAENYPNLKSNTSMLQAQMALKECEDEIAAARRLYDTNVTRYNNITGFFPLNLFAKIFGFKPYSLFEATEQERTKTEMF